MRTITTLVLSVIVATGAGMAFANVDTVEPEYVMVTVDQESYAEGDTIEIQGQVLQRHNGALVIKVISPGGNVVYVGQAVVGSDNMFDFDLATGNVMTEKGTYTIEAHYTLYAKSPRMGMTTFMYAPAPGMLVDGTEFEPGYAIDGEVLAMHTNPQTNSLLIDVETNGGEIMVTLPRDLIDSKLTSGEDTAFFVLVDGEEVYFYEDMTSGDSRTLVVELQPGSQSVEIIGTSVAVPEFGAIAALVLAVAIVSIVAMSRSRFSLAPRL